MSHQNFEASAFLCISLFSSPCNLFMQFFVKNPFKTMIINAIFTKMASKCVQIIARRQFQCFEQMVLT